VWLVPRVAVLFVPVVERIRRANHARAMAGGAKGPRVSLSVEPLKIALAAWTVLVLFFLFIPIILVFVHSFNRGQSFTIWSGHFSTKWWGELFWSGTAWRVLVVGAAIVAGGLVARAALVRFTNLPKRVTNWFGPGAFFAAVAWNWATTDRYRDVFKFSGVGDAVRNSFTAAFGATVIAVLIGGLAGVALARRPGTWTKVFMAVLFLILVTPEIMDAIALVTWFPRIQDVPVVGYPFRNGWGPFGSGMNKLWVGQSLYASAVVTLIVRARLQGLDESLEEAAADLGATPARAFRQVTLPLVSSALVAGGLLSFTLCLDNAVISTLISEAGSTTFPVALLGATRSTIKPFWGVGAMILFVVTMAALWFVAVVLRRSGSSSSDIAATLTGT
jgi:ABC-type spermidine/putrescine transport system permease subunit II